MESPPAPLLPPQPETDITLRTALWGDRRSNVAVLPNQSAEQGCGLDDYHARCYPGWHRHMPLAMVAYACLTILRAREVDAGKAETDPPASSSSVFPNCDA